MKRMLPFALGMFLVFGTNAQSISFDPTFNNGSTYPLSQLNNYFKMLVINNENYFVNTSTHDPMDETFDEPYVDKITNNVSGAASAAGYFSNWNGDIVTDMAPSSNGRLIVVGYSGPNYDRGIFLARMSSSNTVDLTFNSGSIVDYYDASNSYEPHIVRGLSDGKIIVAGRRNNLNFFIMRFNGDGSVDNTFGTNGVVIFDAYTSNTNPTLTDMIVLSDGKMLLSGSQYSSANSNSRGFVGRLNADGSKDNSFGTNGFTMLNFGQFSLSNSVNDIELTAAGDIIAVGYGREFMGMSDRSVAYVAKLNQTGALVTTFGSSGLFNADGIFNAGRSGFNAVSVMSDGKIVVAGGNGNPSNPSQNNGVFVFMNADGTIATSYATGGIYTISPIAMATSVGNFKFQPDGKIVYFASGYDFADVTALGRLVISTSPAISVVSTGLSPFSQTLGSPSAEQTFTVSGSSLSNDITVTAPTNYEVSLTSGSGYASSVQLTQTAGSVPTTTVYIRLNASVIGTHNGDVTLASGSLTETIPITGTTTDVAALIENELNGISVYPNPASSSIHIQTTEPTEVILMDINGKELFKSTVSSAYELNVSELNNGIYFIRTAEGQTVKFIKE